ncbi:MAG: HAMP domain-containing histidine kinase [Verrucomicrobiales bacterium]|nr:HAMP domain-containing histidine kinase [Verrucomicrobiales bacterium]
MPQQPPFNPELAANRNAGASIGGGTSAEAPVLYPLKDVSLMVKTYSHDLRNTLNGMDLDLTLLSEANSEPIVLEAIKRLQSTATEIGRQVQGLMSKFALESPSQIPVIQIVERWKMDGALLDITPEVHWIIEPEDEVIYGEASLIRNLLWEMLQLAQRICPRKLLKLTCTCRGGKAVFEILVPEAPAEPRRVQLQQAYWQALRRLAERGVGRLDPPQIEENQPLSLRLVAATRPMADPASLRS